MDSMLAARVLVVDDNEDAATIMAEALEALGHSVEVATGGAQALVRAESFSPDVVLLDLSMPEMDGYEVARRLRASQKAPRIIALTGWTNEVSRVRSREAGFDQHLVKPVTL